MQQHNTAAECCWSEQNIFLPSLTDEGEQKAICQINYLESIHENNPSDRSVTESYIVCGFLSDLLSERRERGCEDMLAIKTEMKWKQNNCGFRPFERQWLVGVPMKVGTSVRTEQGTKFLANV